MRAGLQLEPEVSFQGGDGYLFFGSPELALATLTRFAEMPPGQADADAPTDPFYRRTDISLDYYRAIRRVQSEFLASRTYARAITAFGLGLLNVPGIVMSIFIGALLIFVIALPIVFRMVRERRA